MADKIKVVIGKIGLDAHDRGILLLQDAFNKADIEVIYPGKFMSADQVVKVAMECGANVIALSDHTGSMLTIAADVVEELRNQKVNDSICVIAGGIIPDEDKSELNEMGVTGLYGQGTHPSIIIDHIKKRVGEMN